MNKKRWIYLIFLTLVFILCFIRPAFTLFSSKGISDSLSFFYFLENTRLISSIKAFLEINAINSIFNFIGINDSVGFVLKGLYIIFSFLFSVISLKIYRSFFEQEERCIHYEKVSIIKCGLVGYGVFLLIILIFMFSIVGYGVALVILFFLNIIALIGSIAFSIYVGRKITKRDRLFYNMFVGMGIMWVLTLIPYLGIVVRAMVLPIISIGVFVQTLYNMFILQKHFEDTNKRKEKNVFNKSEIYAIIVSDRKERNTDE